MVRKALDDLEQDRRTMIAALHANGNIGGDDLDKAIKAMDEQFTKTRSTILNRGAFDESEVEEFVSEQWWNKK